MVRWWAFVRRGGLPVHSVETEILTVLPVRRGSSPSIPRGRSERLVVSRLLLGLDVATLRRGSDESVVVILAHNLRSVGEGDILSVPMHAFLRSFAPCRGGLDPTTRNDDVKYGLFAIRGVTTKMPRSPGGSHPLHDSCSAKGFLQEMPPARIEAIIAFSEEERIGTTIRAFDQATPKGGSSLHVLRPANLRVRQYW